jgi:hypothetical protein
MGQNVAQSVVAVRDAGRLVIRSYDGCTGGWLTNLCA